MSVYLTTNGVTELMSTPQATYAGFTKYVGADIRDYLGAGFTDPDTIYREQRAVRTVVNFIAHNAASVGMAAWVFDSKGDRTEVTLKPVVATLRSPDRVATEYEFHRDMFKDLLLWERFAAVKIKHRDGGILLLRIPPRRFRFARTAYGRVSGIQIGEEVFDQDKFLWLDGYPASESSPMAHLTDLLLEEAESAKFRASLWKNGARISGVVERPMDAPDWTPKARKRFRAMLDERYVGDNGTNLGGTMLLEDGMSYKPVEYMSSRDAQQIEARKLSTSEVAAAYQVPPVFVGVLDNANYSNVKAYREMLYSDVLGPLFTQSHQAWTLRVGKELRGVDMIEYKTGDKLALSFEEQATALQSATGAPVVTRAEARKRMKLPFIEGTEELVDPLNVDTGDNQPADEPPAEEDPPAENTETPPEEAEADD